MANVKTTPDEWRIAREYFESGLSLSKIVEKTGITKSQLSKVSNKEGWSKETGKKELIQKAVDVRMAKETMDSFAVSVHNSIVEERTKALVFFANITHRNCSAVDNMLGVESTLIDRLTAQTIYEKGRTTWLGKEPTNQTNIQNNVVSEISEIRLVPLS